MLGLLGYWGAGRLLHGVAREAHLEEHVRLETEIRAYLASATGAVRALAQAPKHRGERGADERNAELARALVAQSAALDALYFVDADGNTIGVGRESGAAPRPIQDRAAKPGRIDLRAQDWMREAAASASPVWSEPHVLAYSAGRGVSFAAPADGADAHGTREGMAVGEVSFGHLHALVESFSHAGAGDSAVVDAQGKVIARSDEPASKGAADILDEVLALAAAHPLDAPLLDHASQAYLVRATPIAGTPWRLVSWLPEEAVVGGLRRGLVAAAMVLALTLIAALALSLWLSRRITGPVEVLARVARRIGRLEFDNLPRVDSSVEEILRLEQALDESAISLKAFRKFVPADVVSELVKQGRPLAPGGRLAEVTAMFTDIEGFTGISASVPPGVLVPQLTEYFNAAAGVILAHGGTIDKYIGDGMMILWGAPVAQEDAPVRACRAALALCDALDELNAQWTARGLRALRTRIGIHTGPAVVGLLGSSERLAFTAFGDTINVASRIEGANKEFGTRVLASGHTVAALGNGFVTRPIGEAQLRGHGGRWALFEVVASS